MIYLHVESKKYNKLVNIEYINYQKQKQTRRYREQTSGYQQEEGRKEGQYMSKAMEGRRLRDTNHYAWTNSKDIPYNIGSKTNIL